MSLVKTIRAFLKAEYNLGRAKRLEKGECMGKLKEVTKENAELILYKVDTEGFDYCFTDYSDWKEETSGTALEPLIKAYQTAQVALNEELVS